MEYITIERSVFDAMVATLAECRSILGKAIRRLSGNERQEWIDNISAQSMKAVAVKHRARAFCQLFRTALDFRKYLEYFMLFFLA